MSGDNPLVAAFEANPEWSALYDTAAADLRADLIDSGLLTETLDTWVAVLNQGATDVVEAGTITAEADAIRAYAS